MKLEIYGIILNGYIHVYDNNLIEIEEKTASSLVYICKSILRMPVIE